LDDVLYRSHYFDGMKVNLKPLVASDRKILSGMLAIALKYVWYRTGTDSYSSRVPHSDYEDFLNRHPRLIKVVKHIFEEDDGDGISGKINPGTAAGIMFFMASSASKPDGWNKADHPTESKLDWSLWDKASEFWTFLAAGGAETKAVRLASRIVGKEEKGSEVEAHYFAKGAGSGSRAEKEAILSKAWDSFVAGKPITPKTIALTYQTNVDGETFLDESPRFGGIDQGDYEPPEEPEEPPTEEEAAAKKAQVDAEKKAKRDADAKKVLEARAAREAQDKPKAPIPEPETEPEPEPVTEAPVKTAPVKPPKRLTQKEINAEQTKKAEALQKELDAEKAAKAAPAKKKTPAK
jgi:hypothetical protein